MNVRVRTVTITKETVLPFLSFVKDDEIDLIGEPGVFTIGAIADKGQGEAAAGVLIFFVTNHKSLLRTVYAADDAVVEERLLDGFIRVLISASIHEIRIAPQADFNFLRVGMYLKKRKFAPTFSQNTISDDPDAVTILLTHGTQKIAFEGMDPYHMEDRLLISKGFVLIAQLTDTEKPLGMAVVTDDGERLTLEWIFVLAEYRGLGIGRRLIHKMNKEAVSRGYAETAVLIRTDFEHNPKRTTDLYFQGQGFCDKEQELTCYETSLSVLSKELADIKESSNGIFPLSKLDTPLRMSAMVLLKKEREFAFYGAADTKLSQALFEAEKAKGLLLICAREDRLYLYSFHAKTSKELLVMLNNAVKAAVSYMPFQSKVVFISSKIKSVQQLAKLPFSLQAIGAYDLVNRNIEEE